jgi:hypothetical protein
MLFYIFTGLEGYSVDLRISCGVHKLTQTLQVKKKKKKKKKKSGIIIKILEDLVADFF